MSRLEVTKVEEILSDFFDGWEPEVPREARGPLDRIGMGLPQTAPAVRRRVPPNYRYIDGQKVRLRGYRRWQRH